jgi:hypothetical protein
MIASELVHSLPEAHRKHLDPGAPTPMRIMAAKGMAPLPPREMVIVLAGLALDGDPKLAEVAKQTLHKLPDKIVVTALAGGVPAAGLSVLATSMVGRDEILERLALDKELPDAAATQIALTCSERVAEIISNNQERCLRSEPLVRALAQNPQLLRSSKDRVFDFLVRAGVIFDGMPEFGDALARLSPTEVHAAVAKVELPPELAHLLADDSDPSRADTVAEALESGLEEAKERVPMLKLITGLSAAQKVALAIKGNKEARAILVRDSNRIVSGAAIRNPRITEQEIVTAAQSRSVSDEVIRIIAGSKDLTRAYGVKLALVNNPKTPLPTAMQMLTLLRASDLKNVAKSRNVSSAVANQAKRMLSKQQ